MGEYVNAMQTGSMNNSTSTSRGVGDSEPEPPTKRHKADQQLYNFINDYAQTTDGTATEAGMLLEDRYDMQLSSYTKITVLTSFSSRRLHATLRLLQDLPVVAVKIPCCASELVSSFLMAHQHN